ncbi:MAG TPA: CHAD domain-containing protein, partial [Pyrinomonadaceae bacterium]|nr:CHAD domain-containing protein [Pyrinomonadaceae bacterium]
KQIRDVARALGMVRDEDVAILALKKLRHKVDDSLADGIKAFIEERRGRRGTARENLELAINDEAIVELQQKFNAWLDEAAMAREQNTKEASPGGLTFKQVGREVILSQYKELDDLSRSLFNPFDVEPLHEMRIAAKRLRYSLELFCRCFGEELRELAKEIAGLQSSLGELHDCDVWIEGIGGRLKARESGAAENAAEHEAAEEASDLWLLQHFVKERTKHYSDALSRWAEWKATGFYSKLNQYLEEPHAQPSEPEAVKERKPEESATAPDKEEISS